MPRSTIDVFFITAVREGRDLSGVKVTSADVLTVYEVAADLARRAGQLKAGDDPEFARSKVVMDRLPRTLLRLTLRLTAFLTSTLQLEVPPLGLHPNPFGSAMVTSVGMFGLPHGFAPLAWMYDVPLLVLVGEIVERPVVRDHVVVARPVIPITATIDHRYVDGWQVSRLMKAFQAYLAAPALHEPAAELVDGPAPRPTSAPTPRIC